jgi:hypothetical protein
MAVEAPLSKYKKTNLKIAVAVLIGLAVIFGYDGYLSKYEWSKRRGFYDKHVTDNNGVPDGTMNFNRKSPPFFLAAAIIAAAYLAAIKSSKVVADGQSLKTCRQNIDYDSIESIDKTHFESKGFFVITYKDKQGREARLKLSDRNFDNLSAILDELIAKIS